MRSIRQASRIKARVSRRPPELALSIQYGIEGERLPTRPRLRKWVKAALIDDANVTLRLVGTREGRKLNRDYRGRDYATNVLSFPYPEFDPLAGDIVLCAPVIAKEARAHGKPLEAHYAHLVVHGMLHLQGFDHENRDDAKAMETRETEIVIGLGYADPYEVR